MAHFALLDDNNTVVQTIVISNDDILDENGDEQESIGIALCEKLVGPGRWIQTSYNNNFRHRYADAGHLYVEERDVFVFPQPWPSWSLDENNLWQPPIPEPDDKDYRWDEESLTWVPLPSPLPADQQTGVEQLP